MLRRDELWLIALCPPVLGLVIYLAMGDVAGLLTGLVVGALAGPMAIAFLRAHWREPEAEERQTRWHGAAKGMLFGGLVVKFFLDQLVHIPSGWDSLVALGLAICGALIGWYTYVPEDSARPVP